MTQEISPLVGYFRKTATSLFRQPAGVLRHPFVVPGAQYAHELWDWDAYWSTLGLFEIAHIANDEMLRDEAIRHGRGSLLNFFEHQHSGGGIPIMMRSDNPDVFGCFEPGGPERNQAKPVFGQFALKVAREMERRDGAAADLAWLGNVVRGLDCFYAYWETRYKHAATGLLLWGSDVGIGGDNDPTTYARPPFSSINVLLNCLYFSDLRAAAKLARKIGDMARETAWQRRAEEVAALVRTHCWDKRDGFFYALDVQCADHRTHLIPWAKPGAPLAWSALPMRIRMFTGFLPLWCGIASPEQAAVLRQHATNPDTFCAPGGIRSLAHDEPMFTLAASSNPSNWLGPVWIIANYFVWQGLRRYNFTTEADQLAAKTLALLDADITANGATHEFYHPDTCAPIMNKGFISWNLLACGMIRP